MLDRRVWAPGDGSIQDEGKLEGTESECPGKKEAWWYVSPGLDFLQAFVHHFQSRKKDMKSRDTMDIFSAGDDPASADYGRNELSLVTLPKKRC